MLSSGEARFCGVGIHTGREASVVVRASDEGGVRFRFDGETFPIESARRVDAERSTTIVFPNGRRLATVEHLLSAMAGVGAGGCVVECVGPEVPILDGSAEPFARGLIEAGIAGRSRGGPSLGSAICIGIGDRYIAAMPSDELRFTYVIDYGIAAIGCDMLDLVLTRESYLEQVAPARTFALQSEVEALLAAGLALGGSLDNALVVGPDGPIGGGLRVAHEYAAHKMLDLIGDLSLLGEIPKARYICIKGGHSLHYKLVLRMRQMLSAG